MRTAKKVGLVIAGLAVATAALTACSSSTTDTTDTPSSEAASTAASPDASTKVGDSQNTVNGVDEVGEEWADVFTAKSEAFYGAAGDRAVVLSSVTNNGDGMPETSYVITENPDGTSFAEAPVTNPDGTEVIVQQACTVEACFERGGDSPWQYMGPTQSAVAQTPAVFLAMVESLKASDPNVDIEYFQDGDTYSMKFTSELAGTGSLEGVFADDKITIVMTQTDATGNTGMLTASWTYGEPVAIPTDLPPVPEEEPAVNPILPDESDAVGTRAPGQE